MRCSEDWIVAALAVIGEAVRMSTAAQFWFWWSLALLAAVWVIASELRSGEIGGSFMKLRRADKPGLFWSLFITQNAAVVSALAFLAALF